MNAACSYRRGKQRELVLQQGLNTSLARSAFRVSRRRARYGFSLLEMLVSMTVLTVLMTSITVVLRTSRQAWSSHQSDLLATQTAHAVIRHIVRELREADSVVSVTGSTAPAGDLTIRDASGNQLRWQHNTTTKQVLFTDTSVSNTAQVLADNVQFVRFTAYTPNGVNQTLSTEQMQFLKVDVAVPLPSTGGIRAIGSWVWLRNFGRNQAE